MKVFEINNNKIIKDNNNNKNNKIVKNLFKSKKFKYLTKSYIFSQYIISVLIRLLYYLPIFKPSLLVKLLKNLI